MSASVRYYVLFRSSFRYDAAPNISHETLDKERTLCGRRVADAATLEEDIDGTDWVLCLAWSLGHAILTALVSHTATNYAVTYDAILLDLGKTKPARWVGRCKTCRTAHRVDGSLARGRSRGHDDTIVVSGTRCYRTSENGSNATALFVPCCGARVKLQRVYDSARPGKPRHECNAKCMASTGPACECKFKGANHGGAAMVA